MSKEHILSNSKLIEEAVANDEGKLVSNGAFLALTGSRTGRSPKDRFIVEEASTRDQIEWGNVNQPFNSDDFNNLWDKVCLLYTSPSPRDRPLSRMPSSA